MSCLAETDGNYRRDDQHRAENEDDAGDAGARPVVVSGAAGGVRILMTVGGRVRVVQQDAHGVARERNVARG